MSTERFEPVTELPGHWSSLVISHLFVVGHWSWGADFRCRDVEVLPAGPSATSTITCTSTWSLTWSCTCSWSAVAVLSDLGLVQSRTWSCRFHGRGSKLPQHKAQAR